MHNRSFRRCGLALTAPVLLLAGAASAGPSEAIEEILVTADFRRASLMEMPASLTVVDGETITGRAARHLDQVLNMAPNVNYAGGASRGRYFQIRGIGERSQFVDPVNPSVGLTIDGLNFSGIGNAGTLFDIDQVEVLRGPQGTRFGAYGMAGMINLTSAAPTDTFKGYVSGGAGNYDSWHTGAVISGPLAEGLLGRLAVHQNRSDGYIDNTHLGRDDTSDYDELNARGRLQWQATEDLRFDTTLFYVDVDNGYDDFSLDNNRRTLSDEPGHDRQETIALGITGRWTGSDYFVLEATVGYEHSDLEYGFDEDWTHTGICDGQACDSDIWGFDWWYSTTDNYTRDRESAQLDVRLVSEPEGGLFGTMPWVLGVYYYDRQVDLTREFFDWDLGQDSVFLSTYDTSHQALYGQISAPLLKRLTLTAGGRVERFRGDYRDSRSVRSRPGETLWGGEVSLEYQSGDNSLVYGLVSRGFKAGGVNGEALGQARRSGFDDSVIAFLNERLEFETETADNFEIGFKGSYLDDRWQLRLAAFYMNREDVQLRGWYNEGALFVGYIDNGASGTNRGLELETRFQVTPDFALFASLGYLDTEIQDFFVRSGDQLVDKSGRDQAHAPNYQFHAGAEWQITNSLRARLETEGKDRFYFSDSHDQLSGRYALVHGRVSYSLANLELSLWGRNLTDRDYAVRGFYFANDPRNFYLEEENYIQFGEPRTYGVSATYTF